MPELPEVQAHAERLTEQFRGQVFTKFVPFNFTVLKTAVPAPADAYGRPLERRRRGKYLLLRLRRDPLRDPPDAGRAARRRRQAVGQAAQGGLARWRFADGPALLLTEAGKERRAGVWCLPTADAAQGAAPLHRLGPEALSFTPEALAAAFAADNMRVHGFLRDQHHIAGLGRMLANEVCHRARLSPFAMTGKLGAEGAAAVCCRQSMRPSTRAWPTSAPAPT